MNAIWSVLGCERTGDAAEIRRAYARRLKATDVEADPDAFIALRAALEQALEAAAHGRRNANVSPPADGEGTIAVEVGPSAVTLAAPAAEVAPETFTVGEADAAQILATNNVESDAEDDRFVRLERLLFADPETWPDERALVAVVEEIIRHPEIDSVDRGPEIEGWLAQVLAEVAPRSDAAVERVVERFGWERTAGQWDQPWEIDLLVDRSRAMQLVRALDDADHPLHAAWLDLSGNSPEIGIKRFTVGGDVRRLLKLIRERCPAAVEWLNPYRVELWERSRNGGYELPKVPTAMRYLIFGGWGLVLLSKMASCAGPVQPG